MVVLRCRITNGGRHTLRMRTSGRVFFLVHALVFSSVVFGTAPGVQGQSVGGAGVQSAAPGAGQGALAVEWSGGVNALAEKIARVVKPARAISLEVKNISSVAPGDVDAIRKALEAELRGRGLRVGAGGETDVAVTLSENFAGYVWVAEFRRNDKEDSAPRIAIVAVTKAAGGSAKETNESLVLAKRLIWAQPTEFLDFLVTERPTTVMASSLLVLEPDRLVYYRSTTLQWQEWKAIPFPHVGNGNRIFHGRINIGFQKVWGPGGECSGDLGDPDKVTCSPKITMLVGAHVGVKIPDRETYQVEILSERCGDKSVALASGNGDWTQPDLLQGYLFTDVVLPDTAPVGGPVEFEGPIQSMQADDRESLRVVVHNLKTGNYEGYIVTATCSQ
ncbi:MAG: hypothetical protein ACRD59_18105 [Candidatus Acidiferrales bacterium]